MKSRFTTLTASLLAIAAMLAVSKAEDFPNLQRAERFLGERLEQPAPGALWNSQSGTWTYPSAPQAQVQKSLNQLKKAKNDKQKQAASAKLREALNKQFDADMKRREEELIGIQQKLQQMQSALQKRADNKESIVGLRLQVLTNQAEGLGWQGGYRQPAEYDPFAQGIQSLPQQAEAPRFRPTPDEAHLFRSKP